MKIASVLADYAAACARVDIEHQPSTWVIHYDIWCEVCGELGIESSVDHPTAAFAAMIPFAVIPEIADSILILDLSGLASREMALIHLSASPQGIQSDYWWVPFGLDDAGRYRFGSPHPGVSPLVSSGLKRSISTIIRAREEQVGWESAWSFDGSVLLANDLLNRLDIEHLGDL